MAYVGTGTAGKTYIGSGNGQSGTFADIGTNSGLTAHGVVVAEGNSPFTVVSPTATTGVPLVSQGASSDPSFGTCKVAGGGTGTTNLTGVLTGNGTNPFTASTVTEYAVICGDASNKVRSVASVGTAGQVLTSNGAGALPGWTTATYPATTTANQILYSSAANTVAGLTNGTTGQVLTATTGAAPSWAAAGGGGTIVTTYYTSGTHAKNANTKMVDIYLIGGGGGGGSGRRGAAGSNRSGGGGGAGSPIFQYRCMGSAFPNSTTITVGAGGTGGTAQTVDDTNGNNGSRGGSSDIDSKIYGGLNSTLAGNFGSGGGTTSGTGGAAGAFPYTIYGSVLSTTLTGQAGNNGSNTVTTPTTIATYLPVGGGGGGGLGVGDVASVGGGTYDVVAINVSTAILVTRTAGGAAEGGAAGNGVDADGAATYTMLTSMGGGGSGAAKTTAAAAGGTGGRPGGGGGGGGASLNGFNSGAGGVGGAGGIIIIEYV